MLLDDDDFIEGENRRNFKILLEEQRRLTNVVLFLIIGVLLSNTVVLMYRERLNVEVWFVANLIQIVLTAMIALGLNLLVNIIPYKTFTYPERFIRTYLILLMIGYILVIIVLLGASLASF